MWLVVCAIVCLCFCLWSIIDIIVGKVRTKKIDIMQCALTFLLILECVQVFLDYFN